MNFEDCVYWQILFYYDVYNVMILRLMVKMLMLLKLCDMMQAKN